MFLAQLEKWVNKLHINSIDNTFLSIYVCMDFRHQFYADLLLSSSVESLISLSNTTQDNVSFFMMGL